LPSTNPFKDLTKSLTELISSELSNTCPNQPPQDLERFIEEPPRKEFGDLGIPVPRILKACGGSFEDVASALVKAGELSQLVREVRRAGPYVNFFIDFTRYGEMVFSSVRRLEGMYGVPKAEKPERIVVEYVSANPIHPLHVGSGRNAVLGDFIYRVLSAAGHTVQRRYYVDDVGLQVAYLAYGYRLLGRPKPPEGMKPDHYYGLIYAATVTVIDILNARKRLEATKSQGSESEEREIIAELDSLVADLQRIREKIPQEVDRLIDEVRRDEDPNASVAKILKDYESGVGDSELVREVTKGVMEGIKQTLEALGISMDAWDWESDLIREGLVDDVLRQARESPHFMVHKGVPALNFKKLLEREDVLKELKIPKGLEIPPLILVRSDGTTLYTTRDIAYTLKKFREFNADKVINVIAVEQTLSQAQLRLALYALGHRREAANTIHYAYEMVNLPGASMSGRRGRYVTIDELLSSMERIIEGVMAERGVANTEAVRKMARSAFKYMMLSTSPTKTLTFDMRRALDTKQLSGPYLQYTYARANSVLVKSGNGVDWGRINYSAIGSGRRRDLVWLIGKFPSVTEAVLDSLHPEDLVAYLIRVADTFNTWYDEEPILKEPDEGVKHLKLGITFSVKEVLEVGMRLLGLDILERI